MVNREFTESTINDTRTILSNTHNHRSHALLPSSALAKSTAEVRSAQSMHIVPTRRKGCPNAHASKSEDLSKPNPTYVQKQRTEPPKRFMNSYANIKPADSVWGFKRTHPLQTKISIVFALSTPEENRTIRFFHNEKSDCSI